MFFKSHHFLFGLSYLFFAFSYSKINFDLCQSCDIDVPGLDFMF